MSIFTNQRKDMEGNRWAYATCSKSTLDVLKTKDGSDEDRERLVSSAKEGLDSYIALETSYSKYEYAKGKVDGMMEAIGVFIGGFLVGKGIEYLIDKHK